MRTLESLLQNLLIQFFAIISIGSPNFAIASNYSKFNPTQPEIKTNQIQPLQFGLDSLGCSGCWFI